MTDSTLQSIQRREKLLTALGLLKTRYESLFHEPATPRLQSWLAAKIEEEKTQTIKASLSHFETDEILELFAIVSEPTPEQKQADEMAKKLAENLEHPVPKKKVKFGSKT